jgi:hypothetical protein
LESGQTQTNDIGVNGRFEVLVAVKVIIMFFSGDLTLCTFIGRNLSFSPEDGGSMFL